MSKNTLCLLIACTSLAPVMPVCAQDRVDLTMWQTPIKNQGLRRTCQTFAAVAALEARYMRLGLQLDLSEEFVNHVGKMNWLHPKWEDYTGADFMENQVGAFGGGGGAMHLRNMTEWMAVPAEDRMVYRNTEVYGLPAWNDRMYWTQYNADGYNLDPANLPRRALTASLYYRAKGFHQLSDPKNTVFIESALQSGYEVVWEFKMDGDMPAAGIWHQSAEATGDVHVMLIVGYDRAAANPADHYFIVKNSWGPTSHPGGFTHVGYDYVASYGVAASYITSAQNPGPWYEAAAYGRRNFSFDGWHGTLDIYHTPGAAVSNLDYFGVDAVDRRIGTFFDSSGNAFRVNGMISGNLLVFWFKPKNPNMHWDELRESPTTGQQFAYYLTELDGSSMAGIHWNNAGTVPSPAFGGYARLPSVFGGTNGFLSPVFDNSQPVAPEQYLGDWKLVVNDDEYRLSIRERNDSLLPAVQMGTHAGLECTAELPDGSSVDVLAAVPLARPNEIELSLPSPAGSTYQIDGRMLTWERGVFAGRTSILVVGYSYWAVRLGDVPVVPGFIETFAEGCGSEGSLLGQSITGTPEIGERLDFHVLNAVTGMPVAIWVGLSDERTSDGSLLPLPLDVFGAPAPDCFLLIDPMLSLATGVADVYRYFTVPLVVNEPSAVGVPIFSQAFAVAPGVNPLGVISSNAVRFQIGNGR